MSSKRYLLSLALLAFASLALAQTGFWANTDVLWRSGSTPSTGVAVRAGVSSPIDDISNFEVTEYLDWWNFRNENRKQKFNNRVQLGYYYHDQELSWGANYAATAFGGAEAMLINYEWVDGVPDVKYRKQFMHQANLDAEYRYSILKASGELNLRLLDTEPVQVWGDPIEGLNNYLYDGYSHAELGVNPISGLNIFGAYDYKNHPMDEALQGRTIDYDYSALTLGAIWDKKLGLNGHFSLSETWQNRDWDAMLPEHRNQLISELRLGYHLTPDLIASGAYINRSCFADAGEPVYLLSNYARAQVQYVFPNDLSAGSYVLLGAKIRPANDAAFHPDTSAYFAEANYRLMPLFYLGARVNLAPEIQDEYRCRLSYRTDPTSEIHLEYIGRKSQRTSPADPDYHSLIGIGTEVHF